MPTLQRVQRSGTVVNLIQEGATESILFDEESAAAKTKKQQTITFGDLLSDRTADKYSHADQLVQCDYDYNPTPLFLAIKHRKWKDAFKILVASDSVSQSSRQQYNQASVWISRAETSGKLRWRLLPLHASVIFKAPLEIVQLLLLDYPDGICCKDDHGMLPLHLAFWNGSDWDVVEALLTSYPQAIHVKDENGRTPMECASSKTMKQATVLELLRVVQEEKQNKPRLLGDNGSTLSKLQFSEVTPPDGASQVDPLIAALRNDDAQSQKYVARELTIIPERATDVKVLEGPVYGDSSYGKEYANSPKVTKALDDYESATVPFIDPSATGTALEERERPIKNKSANGGGNTTTSDEKAKSSDDSIKERENRIKQFKPFFNEEDVPSIKSIEKAKSTDENANDIISPSEDDEFNFKITKIMKDPEASSVASTAPSSECMSTNSSWRDLLPQDFDRANSKKSNRSPSSRRKGTDVDGMQQAKSNSSNLSNKSGRSNSSHSSNKIGKDFESIKSAKSNNSYVSNKTGNGAESMKSRKSNGSPLSNKTGKDAEIMKSKKSNSSNSSNKTGKDVGSMKSTRSNTHLSTKTGKDVESMKSKKSNNGYKSNKQERDIASAKSRNPNNNYVSHHIEKDTESLDSKKSTSSGESVKKLKSRKRELERIAAKSPRASRSYATSNTSLHPPGTLNHIALKQIEINGGKPFDPKEVYANSIHDGHPRYVDAKLRESKRLEAKRKFLRTFKVASKNDKRTGESFVFGGYVVDVGDGGNSGGFRIIGMANDDDDDDDDGTNYDADESFVDMRDENPATEKRDSRSGERNPVQITRNRRDAEEEQEDDSFEELFLERNKALCVGSKLPISNFGENTNEKLNSQDAEVEKEMVDPALSDLLAPALVGVLTNTKKSRDNVSNMKSASTCQSSQRGQDSSQVPKDKYMPRTQSADTRSSSMKSSKSKLSTKSLAEASNKEEAVAAVRAEVASVLTQEPDGQKALAESKPSSLTRSMGSKGISAWSSKKEMSAPPAAYTNKAERTINEVMADLDAMPLHILETLKLEIKERLRLYDDFIFKTYGRKPQLEDKEPIRDLYDIYSILKRHIILKGMKEIKRSKEQIIKLQSQKVELKQKLKIYDDVIAASKGRAPSPQEREPIRELYEKYDEIKTDIEAERQKLEKLEYQKKQSESTADIVPPILDIKSEDLTEGEEDEKALKKACTFTNKKKKGGLFGKFRRNRSGEKGKDPNKLSTNKSKPSSTIQKYGTGKLQHDANNKDLEGMPEKIFVLQQDQGNKGRFGMYNNNGDGGGGGGGDDISFVTFGSSRASGFIVPSGAGTSMPNQSRRSKLSGVTEMMGLVKNEQGNTYWDGVLGMTTLDAVDDVVFCGVGVCSQEGCYSEKARRGISKNDDTDSIIA